MEPALFAKPVLMMLAAACLTAPAAPQMTIPRPLAERALATAGAADAKAADKRLAQRLTSKTNPPR
ncbi:MAG: hypothetical protein RL339_1074 [Pseudomonadota bacterium]